MKTNNQETEEDKPRKPLGGLAVLVAGLAFIASSIMPVIFPQPKTQSDYGSISGGKEAFFTMGLMYSAIGIGLIKSYKDEIRSREK